MPFRGILLFIVLAAIIAWFYKEDICRWLKDPRMGTDDDDEEENKDE